MEKNCKHCQQVITIKTKAIQIKYGKETIRNECKPCRSIINSKYKKLTNDQKKYPCEICSVFCIRNSKRFFCSFKCRFLGYIKKNECWEWIGTKEKDGYGLFLINKKMKRAHRVSYELFKKPIEKGMLILHSCNNTSCVNPDHLREGTVQENSNDMISANRSLKGSKHHKAKLNEEDVKKIRELARKGQSQQVIANIFGITQVNVSIILRGNSWKHL